MHPRYCYKQFIVETLDIHEQLFYHKSLSFVRYVQKYYVSAYVLRVVVYLCITFHSFTGQDHHQGVVRGHRH